MADDFVGPPDAMAVPRFAGPATFARLPRIDEVARCDVAVVGVPFDAGTSYRPGARFGPSSIRAASRLLRDYNPALDVEPFGDQQVCDAGDIACNPFSIAESVETIESASRELLGTANSLVAIGGDHTIALPLLRTAVERHGPVALLHFDAHLDTWDTYFGAAYTHGTPFRRAWEEGLLLTDQAMHVGIRGPLFSRKDLVEDASFGFGIITAMDLEELRIPGVVKRIQERVADAPLYVSVDIDVLDPGLAPGTGTPEAGGLTSRELLGILRGLVGLKLIGADVVEVSPAYDHSEVTATAACHVVHDLLSLLARRRAL
jgi:guanidinobutyrase / D-arginase